MPHKQNKKRLLLTVHKTTCGTELAGTVGYGRFFHTKFQWHI